MIQDRVHVSGIIYGLNEVLVFTGLRHAYGLAGGQCIFIINQIRHGPVTVAQMSIEHNNAHDARCRQKVGGRQIVHDGAESQAVIRVRDAANLPNTRRIVIGLLARRLIYQHLQIVIEAHRPNRLRVGGAGRSEELTRRHDHVLREVSFPSVPEAIDRCGHHRKPLRDIVAQLPGNGIAVLKQQPHDDRVKVRHVAEGTAKHQDAPRYLVGRTAIDGSQREDRPFCSLQQAVGSLNRVVASPARIVQRIGEIEIQNGLIQSGNGRRVNCQGGSCTVTPFYGLRDHPGERAGWIDVGLAGKLDSLHRQAIEGHFAHQLFIIDAQRSTGQIVEVLLLCLQQRAAHGRIAGRVPGRVVTEMIDEVDHQLFRIGQ